MVHRQLQEVGLRPAWPWIVSTTAHSGWRAPMDTTKWKMNGEDRHTCQRIQDVAELTKRKLQVNVKSGLDKGCSSVRTRVYWLTKKQEVSSVFGRRKDLQGPLPSKKERTDTAS
ncbi:unnamed protein product [Caenorhabditis nigoni]